MKILKSYSFKQTKQIGFEFAKQILKNKNIKNKPIVIALYGQLGAGKTLFVSGFLKGLGIKKRTTSPTFVLIKKFKIPKKNLNYNYVYHIDVYRIKNINEFLNLDFYELLLNPKNILIIEWPEKIEKLLSKNTIKIKIQHTKNENERKIIFQNFSFKIK